jgi:HEAT repeat protein
MPALLAVLTDKSKPGRSSVIFALGHIGPDAKEAIPFLRDGLKDQDSQLRVRSAQALWQIDRGSEPAMRSLLESLRGPSKVASLEAAWSLIWLKEHTDDVLPVMIEALEDRDSRWQASWLLGEMGPKAKAAVPKLRAMMRRSLWDYRSVSGVLEKIASGG